MTVYDEPMKTTSAERMKKLRTKYRNLGLVRLPEIWVKMEHKNLIKLYAKKLMGEK